MQVAWLSAAASRYSEESGAIEVGEGVVNTKNHQKSRYFKRKNRTSMTILCLGTHTRDFPIKDGAYIYIRSGP